jgi:hypothetical protein
MPAGLLKGALRHTRAGVVLAKLTAVGFAAVQGIWLEAACKGWRMLCLENSISQM